MSRIAVAATLAGCSTGLVESTSGGAENLPTLGAGPFGKPSIDFDTPADEPFVVIDPTANLSQPSVLDREDGGFRLWYQRQVTTGQPASIWYTELAEITELPDVAPAEVLTADATWEQDFVGEPSVFHLGGDDYVLFYRGGVDAPAIGRADSSDGGTTWTKHPQNPLVDGATAPSIVRGDDGWLLAYTNPNAPGIYVARSTDGIGFDAIPQAVIVPRSSESLAFDRDAVGSPHVQLRVTAAGREHFGMWFSGAVVEEDGETTKTTTAIGYAGSFDGTEWARFGELDAVLAPFSPSETGPTGTARITDAYLFYAEQNGTRTAIGVASHP